LDCDYSCNYYHHSPDTVAKFHAKHVQVTRISAGKSGQYKQACERDDVPAAGFYSVRLYNSM